MIRRKASTWNVPVSLFADSDAGSGGAGARTADVLVLLTSLTNWSAVRARRVSGSAYRSLNAATAHSELQMSSRAGRRPCSDRGPSRGLLPGAAQLRRSRWTTAGSRCRWCAHASFAQGRAGVSGGRGGVPLGSSVSGVGFRTCETVANLTRVVVISGRSDSRRATYSSVADGRGPGATPRATESAGFLLRQGTPRTTGSDSLAAGM